MGLLGLASAWNAFPRLHAELVAPWCLSPLFPIPRKCGRRHTGWNPVAMAETRSCSTPVHAPQT
eukprot:7694916-Lingulodinium_polyedra.AAC.1